MSDVEESEKKKTDDDDFDDFKRFQEDSGKISNESDIDGSVNSLDGDTNQNSFADKKKTLASSKKCLKKYNQFVANAIQLMAEECKKNEEFLKKTREKMPKTKAPDNNPEKNTKRSDVTSGAKTMLKGKRKSMKVKNSKRLLRKKKSALINTALQDHKFSNGKKFTHDVLRKKISDMEKCFHDLSIAPMEHYLCANCVKHVTNCYYFHDDNTSSSSSSSSDSEEQGLVCFLKTWNCLSDKEKFLDDYNNGNFSHNE